MYICIFRFYWAWVSEVAQSCPTLCHPVDYSLPGSSVHVILQARILEGVAISFSRGLLSMCDCICVCVCVCVCMYAQVLLSIHECICVYICVIRFSWAYVSMYVCIYMYSGSTEHTWVYVCVHMYFQVLLSTSKWSHSVVSNSLRPRGL